MEIFTVAISNASPQVEVFSRRIGGATYQIPFDIRSERQETLAMRWLVEAAKKQKGRDMADALTELLIATAKNEGAVIEKKMALHKLAEANRAFAHFGRR
ncbi:MAG: small subunit ribosomal protein S7 [Candidatus Berkelbacteria bacterium Licking1014_2]|uniref:Small subunit ribosomal protein S7 n=1 Tax=Candidatus Berkelbacteria bacterium Licking1014_2 TaxID=2017146 RepID=A0A554LVW8_9BACT|nr:MAG: small subunit ribosomal protein S7 [Candidatus Berkelbacteria bacterium Licking1014_2]